MNRLFLLALLVGCAHVPPAHHGGGWDVAARSVRRDGIALAPVTFVADLPAPPLTPPGAPSAVQIQLEVGDPGPPPTILDTADPQHAAFLRNDRVGNVRFAGGFIYVDGRGVDVRARLVELGYDAEYRQQAEQWLKATVDDALARRKVRVARVPAGSLPGPDRLPSAPPKDRIGQDDANNPVTVLRPQPLSLEQRQAFAAASGGRTVLLVPMVRTFVSHNGGWFVGQTWGCKAGERLELLLVAYDLGTGEPIWWHAPFVQHFEKTSTPSSAEIDAGLAVARRDLERQLRKRLLE
jgi:hypothetical protein